LTFFAFFQVVSRDSDTFSVFEHVKLEHILVISGPWKTFAENGSAIELWVSFGSGVRSGVDLRGVSDRDLDDLGLLLLGVAHFVIVIGFFERVSYSLKS
jgi:hypothetical protein